MTRTELVARQRAAAERVRRDVLAVDGSLGHPYFRALRRQARALRGTLTHDELIDACASARIIYVGDFHALPACQRYAAELLRTLNGRGGGVALGVEFVYTRQQPILDLRQKGALDDVGFLQRIHYREEWGYDWDGYRELLDTARELDVPVFALDSPPRGGFAGLGRRDRHAARRIAAILRETAPRRLIVLFGESHVASPHLPRQVERRMAREGPPDWLTVLQSPDEPYWRMRRQEQQPDPVRIDARTCAVFHTGPLEKYEAYRAVLQRWQEDVPADEEVDLTPAVHHLIGVLLDWLDIHPERYRLHHRAGWAEELQDALPEVYVGSEALQLVGPILHDHGRTDEEIGEARTALAARGAVYDSRSNAMFLVRYLPGRAAAEAARFLRAALTGRLFLSEGDFVADPAERAYGAAYSEALAYLGARLVDPAADSIPAFEAPWQAAAGAATRERTPVTVEHAAWLERHRTFEQGRSLRPPRTLLAPLRASRRLRRLLAGELGARLGAALFERVRDGRLSRRRLRNVFSRPLEPSRVPTQVLKLLRARS